MSTPSGMDGMSSHAARPSAPSQSDRPRWPAAGVRVPRRGVDGCRADAAASVAPIAALAVLVSRSLRLASRPGITTSWSDSTVKEIAAETSTVRRHETPVNRRPAANGRKSSRFAAMSAPPWSPHTRHQIGVSSVNPLGSDVGMSVAQATNRKPPSASVSPMRRCSRARGGAGDLLGGGRSASPGRGEGDVMAGLAAEASAVPDRGYAVPSVSPLTPEAASAGYTSWRSIQRHLTHGTKPRLMSSDDMRAATARSRPLRIGLMLRGIDEYDGAGVYIRQLLDARAASSIGPTITCSSTPSRASRAATRTCPTCARWWSGRPASCCGTRWRCRSPPGARGVDVLFHHKFSIPVVAPCPTIVQQRGTEYWTFPEYYSTLGDRINRLYNVLTIPIFCRRAERVLTNSDSLAHELEQLAGRPSRQDGDHLRRRRRAVHAASPIRRCSAACATRTASPTSRSSSWW